VLRGRWICVLGWGWEDGDDDVKVFEVVNGLVGCWR
jgi:hypothetical protein